MKGRRRQNAHRACKTTKIEDFRQFLVESLTALRVRLYRCTPRVASVDQSTSIDPGLRESMLQRVRTTSESSVVPVQRRMRLGHWAELPGRVLCETSYPAGARHAPGKNHNCGVSRAGRLSCWSARVYRKMKLGRRCQGVCLTPNPRYAPA